MSNASTVVSSEEAERFRSFERQRHDSLAITYHDFFTPVTTLAIKPLLQAARINPGCLLLDVATGPGSVAAEATKAGARTIGVDLSPGMIALARRRIPTSTSVWPKLNTCLSVINRSMRWFTTLA